MLETLLIIQEISKIKKEVLMIKLEVAVIILEAAIAMIEAGIIPETVTIYWTTLPMQKE